MALPLPTSYKIVILGSSGVGKTSIVQRLISNAFISDGGPTCGADFHSYTANADGRATKLQIWDTAGQERFRAISKAYFRNAVGAILVFDITNPGSFDALAGWLQDLEMLASPNAYILLAANKKDLEQQRQVGTTEVRAFAERHSLEIVETSAASGENVGVAFQRLTLGVLMRVRDGSIMVPQLSGQAPPTLVKPVLARSCC